jgi:hypothetical protein
MPLHDWTRVDAGTFHAFHTAWITHLSEALNDGVLPRDFYALPEQWAGQSIADVLTLQSPLDEPRSVGDEGGVAVVECPPQVGRKLTSSASFQGSPRTLAIRHASGHRIVAFVEITSPANKDRAAHVADFAEKVETALWKGVHAMLIDILPPGTHDPHGMHAAVWDRFADEPYALPSATPLSLASYVAGPKAEAYVEHLAPGWPLKQMPLFLSADRYVNVPLETTYMSAFRGLPALHRNVLEQSAISS